MGVMSFVWNGEWGIEFMSSEDSKVTTGKALASRA